MIGERFILDGANSRRRFKPEPPVQVSIPIKLWHDDLRRPPNDEWRWARSNDVAKQFLLSPYHTVNKLSMDHDLGGSDIDLSKFATDPDFIACTGDETGVDLMRWMCESNCVPDQVRIHSMNPVGADNIRAEFDFWVAHGRLSNTPMVWYQPFDPSERNERA